MSVGVRLKQFLDENNVEYTILTHPPAFTAHDVAQAARTPERDLAKAILVRADHSVVVAVLPANHRLNLKRLAESLEASKAELISEAELKGWFPDCEVGTMPILGNLYNLPVYMDEVLTCCDEVVFNACTHTEAIRMKSTDFVRLAKPTIIQLSEPMTMQTKSRGKAL